MNLSDIDVRIVSIKDPLFEVCQAIRRKAFLHDYGDVVATVATSDHYDSQAIQLLALLNGTPLATVRMLPHSAEFEVEEHMSLAKYRKKGQCIEVSRLSSDPSTRKIGLANALFHGLIRIWRRDNVRFAFISILDNSPTTKLYEAFGFVPISPKYQHTLYGLPYTIHRLDFVEMLDHWRAHQPLLFSFVHQPIDGIG